MFQSISAIAKEYDVSAKSVGQALYLLGIRDSAHPVQKGFPFDQYITHGIARPIEDKQGVIRYYHYDIEPVKEEFEKVLTNRKKTKKIVEEKRESSQILHDGLTKIAALLSAFPVEMDSSILKQAQTEVTALQSHLIDTNITLALPLDKDAKVLLGRLQVWRREQAQRQERPAFTILGNRTLHYLAYYQPHDREELLAIKGIGEKKAAAYERSVLKLIHKAV